MDRKGVGKVSKIKRIVFIGICIFAFIVVLAIVITEFYSHG